MATKAAGGLEEIVTVRSVILASTDAGLREQLRRALDGMRWQVRVASGGAEAMAMLEESTPEALLMDSWLPDLEAGEFAGQVRRMYPGIEVLQLDGSVPDGGVTRSPRRNELLHAMREAQEARPTDTAVWNTSAMVVPLSSAGELFRGVGREGPVRMRTEVAMQVKGAATCVGSEPTMLPELIGQSAGMRELTRLIRLVAPKSATVLIEGETGTGKELVAKAIHRLSPRAAKPFVVLNCAAIPEALLEAELFGHTRGAFTGAVQSRTGRIEAAHGGTLFLDEIGEMPVALQAKMLRFLECGELQRVGENEPMRVDVRVVAATHQPLEQRAEEGTFRLDLYHRLAVFPIELPPLRDRIDDVELLAEHALELMGRGEPRKRLSCAAMACLQQHHWPGNVRELMHVLERASILAGDQIEIGQDSIRLRRTLR